MTVAYGKRDKRRLVSWLERELSARTGTPVSVGASPIGKYPTAAFDLLFSAGLPFASKGDGLVESPNNEAIEGAVRLFDAAMTRACGDLGLTEYGMGHPWSHESYVLAVTLPPMGIDADHDAEAMQFGRWMTDDEVAATGDEPFSDERWINTHFACINVFRSARKGTPTA